MITLLVQNKFLLNICLSDLKEQGSLRGYFQVYRKILKMKGEKNMDNVQEILREEEASCSQCSHDEAANVEAFYAKRNRNLNLITKTLQHLLQAKDYYHKNNRRINKIQTKTSGIFINMGKENKNSVLSTEVLRL